MNNSGAETVATSSRSLVAVALLLFVAQIVLRLSWNWEVLSRTVYPDEANYYLPAAQAVLEQGWRFFLTERSLWNGPVNPLWIALFGGSVLWVKVANAVLLSLAALCIWDIGRRSASLRAGFIAYLLFSVHQPMLHFGGTLLTEPLCVALLVFSWWCLHLAASAGIAWACFGGIFLALAILTRPTLQLFPLILLGALPFLSLRRWAPDFRRVVLPYALVSLLLVVPWGVKNYVLFGKAGLANGFGAVLYLGNDPRTNGDEPIYSELDFDTYRITQPFTHLDSEGDRRLMEAALERIREHPEHTLRHALVAPFKFLFGHPQHYFFPAQDVLSFRKLSSAGHTALVSVDVIVTALIVGSALIALFCRAISAGLRLWAGLLLLYMVPLHSIAFAIPRLALPVFPGLAVLAGCFWGQSRSSVLRGFTFVLCLAVSAFVLIGNHGGNRAIVADEYANYFDWKQEVALESSEFHQLSKLPDGSYAVQGADPYLVLNVRPFIAQRNQVILVQLALAEAVRVRRDLSLQIFWAGAEGASFDEARSKTVALNADTNERWYRVSPSGSPEWQGRITYLRLDLPGQPRKARYFIKRILIAGPPPVETQVR